MFHEQMRRYFEKSQGKIRKLPHPFLFSFEIEVDKILLEIIRILQIVWMRSPNLLFWNFQVDSELETAQFSKSPI